MLFAWMNYKHLGQLNKDCSCFNWLVFKSIAAFGFKWVFSIDSLFGAQVAKREHKEISYRTSLAC